MGTILGKGFTISKTPDENLVKSLQSNDKGESLINEIGPESFGKSVASSSESQSQPEIMNNLTMVMVKRELLDLDDSDAVTIKKEVDPLAEDSAFSDHPEDRLDKDLEEVFDKVTSDQRTNRLDSLSRENELELEIDIPKEELGVFLHASNDNKFAELSERNVK